MSDAMRNGWGSSVSLLVAGHKRRYGARRIAQKLRRTWEHRLRGAGAVGGADSMKTRTITRGSGSRNQGSTQNVARRPLPGMQPESVGLTVCSWFNESMRCAGGGTTSRDVRRRSRTFRLPGSADVRQSLVKDCVLGVSLCVLPMRNWSSRSCQFGIRARQPEAEADSPFGPRRTIRLKEIPSHAPPSQSTCCRA